MNWRPLAPLALIATMILVVSAAASFTGGSRDFAPRPAGVVSAL